MFKKENKDKDNKKNKDYIHNPKELKQKKSKKNPKKKIKFMGKEDIYLMTKKEGKKCKT